MARMSLRTPWTEPARAERLIGACRQMAEEGSGARLAVNRVSDATFIGWCAVTRWNPDHRSASMGYCLAEAAWGHGYATEAARALLQWAFDTLDLNRVQAETDTRNVASARVLEKLGFIREGPEGRLRPQRRGVRLVGLRPAPAAVVAASRAGTRLDMHHIVGADPDRRETIPLCGRVTWSVISTTRG
jgi:RimJ/RimL family protein N-acetyltransferase